MERAHGLDSFQVINDIGAMSFGLWHTMQALLKIGATSFEKVTSLPAIDPPALPAGVKRKQSAARHPTTRVNTTFFIAISPPINS
jgi:hypothetical protein